MNCVPTGLDAPLIGIEKHRHCNQVRRVKTPGTAKPIHT
jgi:hypothetical protein